MKLVIIFFLFLYTAHTDRKSEVQQRRASSDTSNYLNVSLVSHQNHKGLFIKTNRPNLTLELAKSCFPVYSKNDFDLNLVKEVFKNVILNQDEAIFKVPPEKINCFIQKLSNQFIVNVQYLEKDLTFANIFKSINHKNNLIVVKRNSINIFNFKNDYTAMERLSEN